MEKKELKIVVVEDDPQLGKSLQAAIKGAGYQVQLFAKPDEALASSKFHLPHLYIVDCLLPKISGVNLVIQLRSQGADTVPFILTSGIYKDKSFIKDTLQKTKASGFLLKPFNVSDLVTEIDTQLKDLLKDDIPEDPFLQILLNPAAKLEEKYQLLERITEFNGYDLPRYLQLVLDPETNGIVELQAENGDPILIHIYEGMIVKIEMKTAQSLFGVLLVKMGLVSEKKLEDILQAPNKKPLGEKLVEANLLSPHMIRLVNQKQLGIRIEELIHNISYKVKFSHGKTKPTEVQIDRATLMPLFGQWTINRIDALWLQQFYSTWIENPIFKTKLFTDSHSLLKLPPLSNAKTLLQKLQTPPVSLQQLLDSKQLGKDEIYQSLHTLVIGGLVGFEKAASKVSDRLSHLKRIDSDMEGKDNFEILGVTRTTPSIDVKKTYHELAKTFHPDKLPPTATEEVRRLTKSIFTRMTLAYETLTNESLRTKYVQELDYGQAELLIRSETLIEEGRAMLKANQAGKALEKFKEAQTLRPPSGEITLLRSWAQMMMTNSITNKSLLGKIHDDLNNLPQEDRNQPMYYHVRGLLLKHQGQTEQAVNAFRQALQLNAQFVDANREINLIQLTQKNKSIDILNGDIKDVVGKLFGRRK